MRYIIQLFVCLFVAASVIAQRNNKSQAPKESLYGDAQLRCKMVKRCRTLDTCELPCKLVGGSKPPADEVLTTSGFIDEQFEELWDDMQERMKGLNEHQEELIAQQHDLLGQQRIMEKENRKLKIQQSDLLERQEYLEEENERLKALSPGSKDDEAIRKKIRELETKIKVLTQQQKKLSSQQNRLVEQQNRLMARQRKLEGENVKLRKRQEHIEESGFASTPSPAPKSGDISSEEGPVDPRIESKLDSIKKEMEYRIQQLTGQQEQLLREQTKLIQRQGRLEEENDDLRAKQMELYVKQSTLERENRELRLNMTHKSKDPEIRRERIEATGLCEIEHGNICFGLLGDGDDELTYDLAQENCRLYGGSLANIYDKEHYDKIKTYFLNKTISSGVWLGMTYNPINYKSYLSDGTEAPFVKWNWVYPVSFASYTSMYLYIDEDPKSIYSGMVNLPGTWKYPFALCQFGRI